MNVAILGGSFNPVHNGHIFLAGQVLERSLADKILFIPAFVSPHKLQDNDYDMTHHRIEMLERALEGENNFLLEMCEIERGGISYSYDTISYIAEKYSCERPGFIMGDDLTDTFSTWKNPECIAEKARLIVAVRDRSNFDFKYSHKKLDNYPLEVSSTKVRELWNRGESIDKFVPPAVRSYIEINDVYKNNIGN